VLAFLSLSLNLSGIEREGEEKKRYPDPNSYSVVWVGISFLFYPYTLSNMNERSE
jgi:hypothetical protein